MEEEFSSSIKNDRRSLLFFQVIKLNYDCNACLNFCFDIKLPKKFCLFLLLFLSVGNNAVHDACRGKAIEMYNFAIALWNDNAI